MLTYARATLETETRTFLVKGDRALELSGDLFSNPEPTGREFPLAGLKLLAPCVPPKILAVGQNYSSHLGGRPKPKNPEMFYKPVSSLQDPGGPIVLPPDAEDVHYEGELVVVIGRTIRHASR